MKPVVPKSSINPWILCLTETDANKYLNQQAAINLAMSESTIPFQFWISKVNGGFAGLSVGYFPSHGTCSQWLPGIYGHIVVSQTSVRTDAFGAHTKSQYCLLRGDLVRPSAYRLSKMGSQCSTPSLFSWVQHTNRAPAVPFASKTQTQKKNPFAFNAP